MRASTAMLFLIAAMTITGANVPLSKAILAAMPVEALIGIRFVLATALLLPLARIEPGPRLGDLSRRQWLAIIVLGAVGSLLFTLLLLEGVRLTSATDAGIITASLPAVVALVGLAMGERLRPAAWGMIALAVAGVALIQGGNAGGSATLIGNLLVGLAVLCEVAFVLASRGVSRGVPPLRLSLAVALVGLVGSIPIAVPALTQVDWAAVPATTWVLVTWYTLSSSVLTTVLWYRGVAHVAPWHAGLATAALPVSALALSAIVLGESIGPRQLAGAALVIAAIVLGARQSA